ncbi:hypothetical protein CBS101457_004329 [Exobasidium rhododendri]|nr:hypothetical protein CBS101457_004329 [Exobasidium rhododendri]
MPVQARTAFPKPSTTFRDVQKTKEGGAEEGTRTTIEEYRALKGMPRCDEALQLLREIGRIVRPIMLKHKWRLPLLVEVFPRQENLLGFNVNAGHKIALRLRQAVNSNDFIDESSIVETMLHELAHNLRGPHDDIFYQHLDTLTREWYELQRADSHNMLAGQGFLSGGLRLGGSASHASATRTATALGSIHGGRDPVDLGKARQKAAEMAEKRRRLGEIMAKGCNRLGAASPTSSPLTGDNADAARRKNDISRNCPSGSVVQTQAAAQEQAEQELLHGIQVITIEDGDDDNEDVGEGDYQSVVTENTAMPKREHSQSDEDDVIIVDIRRSTKKAASSTSASSLVNQTRAAAALRQNILTDSPNLQAFRQGLDIPSSEAITHQARAWTCQQCTLQNSQASLTCQACDAIRPGLPHWICANCNHRMMGDFSEYWLCTECGQMKVA